MLTNLKKDLLPGVVVTLVALPLCLGIAHASGAPIISGVISGIIGGIVVGLLSGSHTSVSGPAAGLTAIVLVAIQETPSFNAFLVAVLLAGVFQVLIGLLKAGKIVDFFPSYIIKGLLAAIGIILILKQIPHAFGYDVDNEGDFYFWQPDGENTFTELFKFINYIHPGAILISVLSFLVLMSWERVKNKTLKLIPGSLLAVLTAVLCNEYFSIFSTNLLLDGSHLVQLPMFTSDTMHQIFTFPDFNYIGSSVVLKYALIIGLVASLETLLNVRATDKLDPKERETPANRELMAQGAGNIVNGLIGGIPLTSVIVRSSVNIQANNASKLATIIHGILLACCLLFIPEIINKIPLASLAAILILTGYKLAKPKIFKEVFNNGHVEYIPFLATVLGIVFTDLLVGVLIGIGVSIVLVLISNFKNPFDTAKEQHYSGEMHRLILAQHLSFFNKPFIMEKLKSYSPGSKIMIDGTQVDFIDSDIVEYLKDYKQGFAKQNNIHVNFIKFREEFKLNDLEGFNNIITKEIQTSLSPEQVLEFLKAGNDRFMSGTSVQKDYKSQVENTSGQQFPMAAVLGCIDSRTSSELIFDSGIGDVFSVRVAGNIVNNDIVASLEYATQVAGAKVIVVLGHSGCGAIKSAIAGVKMGNITELLEKIQASYEGIVISESDVTLRNVLHSMKELLKMSPILKELLDQKKIMVVGAIYDIETGKVNFI
jgi:carbonic anhydrase